MPTDHRRRAAAPENNDPEQTQFFKRRKQRISFMPLIVICGLVLGSGSLVVWAINQSGKRSVDELTHSAKPDPFAGRPIVSGAEAAAGENPAVQPTAIRTPAPVKNPTGTPAPAVPTPADNPDTPPNLDLNAADNAEVRTEVLHRVDLMPGISASDKDKLYASVDRAHGMGRVLTVPFEKGESTVRPADIERLRQKLAAPPIKNLLDDPTVVLVILGYADQKGNEKINAEVSLTRARSVLDALRGRCGFRNVMHAVAMGGSNLFSARQAEKNRVVEIWAVVP